MNPNIDFLEKLLDVILEELPPVCKNNARKTPGKQRVSLEVPQFSSLIGSQKLVKMFIRKTQDVIHVMCPPQLDLEKLGYQLHEKWDRDGDQKLLWSRNQAETNARKLGQDLATFL